MKGRYLVTGGAGFIGSHLVDALLAAGERVRVLDNFSTGREENLAAHRRESRLEVLRGDVGDPKVCGTALREVTHVLHLAAEVSVARSMEDPLGTTRTNVLGTLHLLEGAAQEGVEGFVLASTCAVYGNNPRRPLNESSATGPLSPYAVSKLAAEHYVDLYRSLGRVPGLSFRMFNIYGPRQDPSSPYSGVISVFVDRLIRGEQVTIFGDGDQTRDFVFVRDVVEAYLRAVRGADQWEGVYPLATGRGVSVNELYAMLASRLGGGAARYGAAREGEVRHSVGDAARYDGALRALGLRGFFPTPLEEGLETLLGELPRATGAPFSREERL